MARTALYSFAGAGVGFLLAFVAVAAMTGREPAHDTAGISLVLGSVVAGLGAVAGALIGGTADLLDYFRKRDDAARGAPAQHDPDSTP